MFILLFRLARCTCVFFVARCRAVVTCVFLSPGVALLPFVDEKRLHAALKSVYPNLNDDEIARNVRGSERLFVGPYRPSHDRLGTRVFLGQYYASNTTCVK